MSAPYLLQPPAITALERDLLRCCLLPAAASAEAWQHVAGHLSDAAMPASLQPLLGLLGAGLRAAGLRPDEPLAGRLRTAQAIEGQRNDALCAIAGQIIGMRGIVSQHPLIVGGLATAMLAWPQPMLRHTSRIALLLPSPRAAREAAHALTGSGAFAIEKDGQWIGSALRLSHRSGMPVILHGGYCAAPAWGMTYAQLAPHAITGVVGERAAAFGDLRSCLALVALDALKRGEGASLLWLADAVFVLRRLGEAERTRHLPGPVILPLVRRAAEIDPALQPRNDAGSPNEAIAAMAALRGIPAALAPMGAVRRVFWFCRLAPRAIARGLRGRLRPRS